MASCRSCRYRPSRHARRSLPIKEPLSRSILSERLLTRLQALSEREGATLFMTLLTAYAVALYRHSGQTDVLVGSPVAHRVRTDVEQVVGCFINTLVFRTDLSEDPRFSDLLARVRDDCLEAYSHQDLPFEKLVEEMQPARDLSHSPIFQAMLVVDVDTPDDDAMQLGEATLTPLATHSGSAKFDLTLGITQSRSQWHGWLEYSTDLFDRATVERFVQHFRTLLEHAVEEPARRIDDLEILTSSERQELLVAWNTSARDYPRDRCAYQLIEEQAARTPEAVAVVCDGHAVTYGALNDRANQLARHLRVLGVTRDTLVGVCLERSVDLLVGLLGVAKAGGAYVPLDPLYPTERVAYILEDAQASFLLTETRLAEPLAARGIEAICLDSLPDTLDRLDATNLEPVAGPTDLSYVIYTSGSTGKPKGVMIEHRSLVNFLMSMADRPGLGADAVMVAVTTISFDIAALELYLPLMHGGTVVMATTNQAGDARLLATLLDEAKATHLQATTRHVAHAARVRLDRSAHAANAVWR